MESSVHSIMQTRINYRSVWLEIGISAENLCGNLPYTILTMYVKWSTGHKKRSRVALYRLIHLDDAQNS